MQNPSNVRLSGKQDQKGFWSTNMSCNAILDINSALKWSPIQVLT